MGFGRGGGGGRGGAFRGGRGGRQTSAFTGPPDRILEVGSFKHACEDQIVCQIDKLDKQVPYFNGRVFLENKSEIGKIDEILGPLNKMFISVNLAEGVKSSTIPTNTRIYVDAQQLLPLERFLPKPPAPKTGVKKAKKNAGSGPSAGRTGFGGSGRGGFGGFNRGGRGGGGRGRGRGFGRGR